MAARQPDPVGMFDENLGEKIRQAGVVAVLVIDDADDGVPVARALLEGGVTVMELTLRTPAALEALRAIAAEVPEMVAGAGTVLETGQVAAVAEAGAAFAVSPGVNPAVVKAAQERGLPFAPGVMTPTDIETAVGLGCRLLKFFPAESSGGLAHLKNIAAPYAHLGLSYVPLGGLNAENMTSYVAWDGIAAIGGSWLAKREVIAARDWSTVTAAAQHAVGRVQEGRGGAG